MKSPFSIVIPVYNEEEAIGDLIGNLKDLSLKSEIIVVDDGSTDNTPDILERFSREKNIKILTHHRCKGYGAALKTGIVNSSCEVIVTLDADGQHDINDIPKLLDDNFPEYDMVIGNRINILHSPIWRMPGKWLLNQLANYLSRRKIPDLNCGFRAFKKETVLYYLHILSDRFSFSTTSTLAFLCGGHEVKFVPIKVKRRKGRSMVT